jgi:hypothetical protein
MHLSLKGSMDRQPLTDRLGDRLLAEYGGAAAAYSLRALNGNGDSVVRVRRASDNDEEDFTAEQIELGEMVNWVNSQTVPPLDIGVETSEGRIPVPEGGTSIGTPAAAYSLRNLSTTYTGNVVDVRRSSDNAVASFTAAEVADGTLTDWVNEDVLKFNPSNTTASGWYVGANISFVAGDDYMQFTGAGVRTTAGNMLGTSAVRGTDGSYSITFDAKYVSGGSLLLGEDYGGADILSVSPASNGGEWASYTVSVNPWNGSSTSFTINRRIIFTTSSGSVWQLRNVEVSQVEADGFVSKWYDQSGNDNHATQGTAASQPKIVDGGSLVSGGLDFDGVDDVLGTSLVPPNEATLIGVANWDIEDQSTMIIGARDSVNQRSYLAQTSSGQSAIGVSSSALPDVDIVAGDDYLLFGVHSGSTRLLSTNGSVISDSGGSAPNNTIHGYSVGALNTVGTNGSFMDGTLAEVIIYPSDQSANRTAIEANIGETYGITGIPAYDNTVDGFVETWYDQSGNGNDATQSVAGNQPKIVDAGVLVSGGLDFDGVDDLLELSGSGLDIFKDVGYAQVFAVAKSSQTGTGSGRLILATTAGSAAARYVLADSPTDSASYRIAGRRLDSDPFQTVTSNSPHGNLEKILTGFLNYNDSEAYLYQNGTNVATELNFQLAGNSSNTSSSLVEFGSNGFDGTIREIIIYPSDQSANRVAIETNINDHYDIYP